MRPFSPGSVNNLDLISGSGTEAQLLQKTFPQKRKGECLINNTTSVFTGPVMSTLIRCLHIRAHGNAVRDVSKTRFKECNRLNMVLRIMGKQ